MMATPLCTLIADLLDAHHRHADAAAAHLESAIKHPQDRDDEEAVAEAEYEADDEPYRPDHLTAAQYQAAAAVEAQLAAAAASAAQAVALLAAREG
jgi:hypothetical protein